MQILEKHFFDSPLGLVCLAVADDGYAVKSYLGPVPASLEPDAAAALVVAHGAACSLQMALAMCGPRTWRAVAQYEPAIATLLGMPAPSAELFNQGRRSGPPAPGPAETIGTPAVCNCGPMDRQTCYFIRRLGLAGCAVDAELLAERSKDKPGPAAGPAPLAPATGLAHAE